MVKNVIRFDENDPVKGEITLLYGRAKDISCEIKAWICEDIYTIPYENHRSFLDDEEFSASLRAADDLDTLAEREPLSFYCIEFSNYFTTYAIRELIGNVVRNYNI